MMNLNHIQQKLALSTRRALDIVSPWQVNQPAFSDSNYRNYVQEGYKKNELVYACIREVATSASEPITKVVLTQDGTQYDIPDHPLNALLANPTPDMTGPEWWETILTLERIAGNAYIWKERNDNEFPIALWPLRPDWVRIRFRRDNLGQRAFFEYSPGGIWTPEHTVPILPEDMIHIKHGVDPEDIHGYGQAPLRSALRNTDLDNNMTDYFKVFFDNAAVPFGILKVKGHVESQKLINRIRRRWQAQFGGGKKNWHAPAILTDDTEYEQLGLDMEQLRIDALRDVPETRICMAFGVHPILVGAQSGLKQSTYTNYREARSSFWEETLSPLFRKYAARLTADLIPDYGDDVKQFQVIVDTSNVRALSPDVDATWKRATTALKAGGITQNMFLRYINMPPVKGGDVFLIPQNILPVPAEVVESPARRSITYHDFQLRKAGVESIIAKVRPLALPAARESDIIEVTEEENEDAS